MEEQVRNNILRILDATIEAIKKEDIKKLRSLSNETVHDATVYQDEYSITLAVLLYSLSKIYEREPHYGTFKGWKTFCFDCFRGLEVAKEKLASGDIVSFDLLLKKYISNMDKVHIKLRAHVRDVLHRAKITKASRLYEHGLSLGRTAELLGISRFELMDYVGKTHIVDTQQEPVDVAERLKLTRRLFE